MSQSAKSKINVEIQDKRCAELLIKQFNIVFKLFLKV